jgi:hypothetical protein
MELFFAIELGIDQLYGKFLNRSKQLKSNGENVESDLSID